MDGTENIEYFIVDNLNKNENSKSLSNFNVYLNTNKFMSSINTNKLYQVAIDNVSFFNTIWNINSYNNILNVFEIRFDLPSSFNTSVIIPKGVYDITQLLSALTTQLNTVKQASGTYLFSLIGGLVNLTYTPLGPEVWNFNLSVNPFNPPTALINQEFKDLLGYFNDLGVGPSATAPNAYNLFWNQNCIYLQSNIVNFNTPLAGEIQAPNPLNQTVYVVAISKPSFTYIHQESFTLKYFSALAQPFRKLVNFRITDRLGNDVEGLNEFTFQLLVKQLPPQNIVAQ